MSDWSRPDPTVTIGGRNEVEPDTFEIPLDGDGPEVVADEVRGGRPGDDRRRPVGKLAAWGVAAVAALGVGTAVVVSTGDDEAPVTTIDPEELAASITVPAPLTRIEPSVASAPGSDGDRPGGAGPTSLPPFSGTADDELLDGVSIAGATARLELPAFRRSHTRYVAGAGGFALDVTIDHDPTTQLYRVVLDAGSDSVTIVVDAFGGWTYGLSEGEWTRLPSDALSTAAGSAEFGDVMRSMLLGPIRNDTRGRVVERLGVASLDGEPVREYLVAVDAGIVPEWANYLWAPTHEAPPVEAGTELTLTAHVDADGRLRRVAGATPFGATTQSFVHTIEVLRAPQGIELPTEFGLLDDRGFPIRASAELVPDYPAVAGSEGNEVIDGSFDLTVALEAFAADPPDHATIEMIGAVEQDLVARRDPVSGIVRVEIAGRPPFLVDPGESELYLRRDDDAGWESAGRADPTTTALVTGVIADGTRLSDAAPVERLVRRDDGTVLRRHDLLVPPDSFTLPPVLVPASATLLGADAPVAVRAYVDGASRLVELQVIGNGPVPQALVQRFDHDAEQPTISLDD